MLKDYLKEKLGDIKKKGRHRRKVIAHSPTDIKQQLSKNSNSVREYTLFCSNDYLGLASHPDIRDALIRGVETWGGGSGASHLISGHMNPHEQLEERFRALYSEKLTTCRCLTFSSGYMANLAVLTSIGDAETELFSDELNHASLIDGMRLAKGKVHKFKHMNYDSLAALLETSAAKNKVIVSDGVFSMDGSLADLKRLVQLASEYDAWIILDDAHGYGVLGGGGLGLIELENCPLDRVILIGTLGKSAGLSGAFVVADETIIEYIFQTGRSYIYTTASLPAVSSALLTSLNLIHGKEGVQLRHHLSSLKKRLRAGFEEIILDRRISNWRYMGSDSAIQPLIVGDSKTAMELAAALDNLGFRIPAIRPPTVPENTSRLRITLSAAHSISDVDGLLNAFRKLL